MCVQYKALKFYQFGVITDFEVLECQDFLMKTLRFLRAKTSSRHSSTVFHVVPGTQAALLIVEMDSMVKDHLKFLM